MKTRYRSLLIVLAAVTAASAQLVIPYPYYPRVVTEPSRPMAGDDVLLRYVKGRTPSDCVPTYSDQSVRVETSALAVFPPHYIVYLSYAESAPHGNCPGDSGDYGPGDFVEYGTEFDLNNVPIGTYDVRDAMNGDSLVGSFRVGEPYSIAGVVTDDPGTMRRMPQPLEDVLVQVVANQYPIMYDAAALPEAPYPYPYPSYFFDTTRTVVDGTYELGRVPQGAYRVTFSKQGFITQTLSLYLSGDTVVNVQMLPVGALGTVNGTVHVVVPGPTPTSPVTFAPCMECTVSVYPACNDIIVPLAKKAEEMSLLCIAYQAITDAQGWFEVDSMYMSRSGEPVTVTARKSGYTPATVDTAMHYMIPTEVNLVLIPQTLDAGSPLSRAGRPGVTYLATRRAVRVRLDSRQTVTVSLHALDGRLVRGASNRSPLGPGTHTITLPGGVSPGVYLARVRGVTVDETLRVRMQ
ncbi:MAG: hypothetical protein GF331_18950 [Chitinivibrionales bacterium]|nr:hypothetical protein [Chitinivibrionales bacterium]